MRSVSVQILHCSDTHLDKSFGISNLSKAMQRREDLNRNFSSIVDYALENKPDIFLIAGDVFDKISPSNASRVFLTSKIKLLHDSNIATFIIGEIAYILSLAFMRASFNPDPPRIVPIETIGFEGQIIIFFASFMYSKTPSTGFACSIPLNSTPITSGAH